MKSITPKGAWFRQKYYLENGQIKPIGACGIEWYNPFDYYKKGQRVSDNLHQQFVNLDIDNEEQVERFYNKFGPLGLIGRDIVKIVRGITQESKKTGLLVVLRDTEELITIADFFSSYGVSADIFGTRFIGKQNIPSKQELMSYATESLDQFKAENRKVKYIFSLLDALTVGDHKALKGLLDERKNVSSRQGDAEGASNDYGRSIEADATAYILKVINDELAHRAYPQLIFGESGIAVSEELTWQCDSLLTYIYIMLMMDVSTGIKIRKCHDCGRFFQTSRHDMNFCSLSCQGKYNTRTHRALLKQVNELNKQNIPIEEIALRVGRDVESIKRWIDDGGH